MKLKNFAVLLLSGNNKAVNKKLTECIYKPGGYTYNYTLCLQNEHLYLKAYMSSYVQQRQILSPASGIV